MRRLLLLLVLSPLAGCGGGAPASGGARVFATSCRSCHTIERSDHRNVQGGPLAAYGMTLAQIESFTRVMPVRLSPRQLEQVSRYVLGFQARGR